LKQHPDVERKIKKRLVLQDMVTAKELYHARVSLYRKVADYESMSKVENLGGGRGHQGIAYPL
jgi:hypothetical protein